MNEQISTTSKEAHRVAQILAAMILLDKVIVPKIQSGEQITKNLLEELHSQAQSADLGGDFDLNLVFGVAFARVLPDRLKILRNEEPLVGFEEREQVFNIFYQYDLGELE